MTLHRKAWLRGVYYVGLLLFMTEYGRVFGGPYAGWLAILTAYDIQIGRRP